MSERGSGQPPDPRADPAQQFPPPGTMRCPRCSANLGPEQDWCLQCGAPARTRLAPTPNWQLPTVAIGAIIAVAGAMLAFAFVRLTDDTGGAPATTIPATTTQPTAPATTVPPIAPAATVPPVATATTSAQTQTQTTITQTTTTRTQTTLTRAPTTQTTPTLSTPTQTQTQTTPTRTQTTPTRTQTTPTTTATQPSRTTTPTTP